MRTGAIVWLPIVLVNVLVSRDGVTVFARLGDLGPFGQGDLTVEALVYGAVIALKVMLLILITTLASLAVDPDELLQDPAAAVVSLGAHGVAGDAHDPRARPPTPSAWPRRSGLVPRARRAARAGGSRCCAR